MNDGTIKPLLLWLGSAALLVFCLAPFVFMIITSLGSGPLFLSNQAIFHPTLDHYKAILTTESLHFIAYLRNSLIVAGLSSALTIFIAGLAAYAIARLTFPGRVFVLFFVLAVSMFPQISLMSYLFKMMTGLDWINTYQGLVLPYVAWALPLAFWVLVSYFSQMPRDLDKAALVDGCSNWQVLRKVIFPVAAPSIFSTALLVFIFSFNEFLFALMLTTDYQARTIPVGVALFQGLHGETPWGDIMAAAAFSTAPIVLLTLIFQRRIVQGLTRGAIKG